MTTPTNETYGPLETAYDFFNIRLFKKELSPCIFTMTRNPRTAGYYSPKRWERLDQNEIHSDEIAINPLLFKSLGLKEAMQTLVHEMCHSWQEHHGKPSRKGYHNKEWADKMELVGLIPSSTGKPGGNRVGQNMSDYAAEGGEFMVALNELTLGGFALQWHDRLFDLTRAELTLTNTNGSNNQDGTQGQGVDVPVKLKGRSKFHCTECRLNAWAKPSATLVCGDCNKVLEAVL